MHKTIVQSQIKDTVKKVVLLLKFVRWPVFAAYVTWSAVKVTLHLRQLIVDMIKQHMNNRKQALLSEI